jgi:hypothetical protein
VEVRGSVQASDLAQADALGVEALFDLQVIFNLDELGRHDLPPAYAMFERFA